MVSKFKPTGLLQKYQDQYRKNPRSRVFAPLAECYRKLGMLDEALKVLRDGLRYNPTYVLGYLVLSQCYYDQSKFDLVYDTLRTFVSQSRDNILMQKIFSDVCYRLGFLEEALETYKYLLYLNPKDVEAQTRVKYLEDTLMVSQAPVHSEVSAGESNEDDWVLIHHGQEKVEDDEDQWVAKVYDVQPQLPILTEEKFSEISDFAEEKIFSIDQLEDSIDPNVIELKIPSELELIPDAVVPKVDASVEADHPVMTLTIVDLYLDQGYVDKAKEILQKILEISPGDKKVLEKLSAIDSRQDSAKEIFESKVKEVEENLLKYSSEDEGHHQLLDIIDHKVKNKSNRRAVKIVPRLEKFLERVKVVAQIRKEAEL